MLNQQNNKIIGFTLVELIVVITIVGILSTVGFVSYSGYLAGARDSNRFSQLTKLSDSLQVYAATKSLPLPDDYIEVTASGAVIAYQGYVGVDVLETIDYTNGGKDPKDDSYFTYYLTKDRKNMQLLAFMEEQSSVTLSSQTFAADYTERVPKVYGKKLGVLTESVSNTPVQEESGVTEIDIVNTTDEYTAYFSDTDKITGTGSSLAILRHAPLGSLDYISSLVGYWDMESIYSTDMLFDLSGNDSHLTNINSITIGDISQGSFSSTNFDSSSSQRFDSVVGTNDILDITDNFSISLWVYPHSYKTTGYFGTKNILLVKSVGLGTINYGLQLDDANTVSFMKRGASENIRFFSFASIPDMTNTWTHITTTIKNNTVFLYINGKLYDSQVVSVIESDQGAGSDRLYFGGVTDTETMFDGYMDEVRIYNTALSDLQIEKLYNNR